MLQLASPPPSRIPVWNKIDNSVWESSDPNSGNGNLIINDPSSSSSSVVSNHATQLLDQLGSNRKHYMPVDLYRATKANNADQFLEFISKNLACQGLDFTQIVEHITPAENTVLHVAANHGNNGLVKLIFRTVPSLVIKQNFVGDTALHLAVKAGHLPVIHTLLYSCFREKNQNLKLLQVKNRDGNTALHEFVISPHYNLSIMSESVRAERLSAYSCFNLLIKENPELCYMLNNEGKSPLYLAAEARKEIFVKEMLVVGKNQNCDDLLKAKSPLLPAIRTGNKGLFDTILQIEPAFINVKDEEGKTPLHHAASVGCIDIIKCLLKKDGECTLKRDNNGVFPVHMAAGHGHLQAIMELLEYCPEPEEMLTSSGQNILHVAAARGNYNVVRFLLKKYSCLTNDRDINGNTPLHLATMNWHPRAVSVMTWDKSVDLSVVNNAGLTALDVAEYSMGETQIYEKRLTWIALKAAGASRAPKRETTKLFSQDSATTIEGLSKHVPHTGRYRDRVNTLLVVATLVATVTFAAGFTMPGGNNEDPDANQGMANMLHKKAFHVFILCDTIAMLCSILVVISLIWAQLGDLKLVLIALKLAIPLLGIGLVMMSLAFMAGVYLVVTQLNWLAYAVLIVGFIFIAAILVLLLPLCLPLYSPNRILRYITYYPFYLFILLTVKSEDKTFG